MPTAVFPAALIDYDARTPLPPVIRLALVFASIKLLIHIITNLWQAHLGWGYFGDEMYYILCGRHLAWGYVDHGPLVAVQANLALMLFGKSLAGIRMLSALGGAARVFLTGLLTWSLGGRRPAQALAMIGVLVCPQYLATDSYLSMNSIESTFWMGCLLVVILMVQGRDLRLWIPFGLSAGLGLLNKPSMAFFLAALLAALLVSPQRRILWNRWAALGVVLLVAIVFPNLVWQLQNHWPTLEFLNHARSEANSLSRRNPFAFLIVQCLSLGIPALPMLAGGLWWLLSHKNAREYRWIALLYLGFLAVMIVLRAKNYYVTPVCPILFAAGGVAWELYFARLRRVAQNRILAFPLYEFILVAGSATLLPALIPSLRAETYIAFTKAVHMDRVIARAKSGPFPEYYADRFGWQEETDEVTRIYRSLSPQDRQRVGIFCQDYGQASGINFLGSGLPFATSGHNNYYLWGPHGETGDVMILLTGSSLEELQRDYASVEVAGRVDNPYSMPAQKIDIYLARGRRKSLLTHWAEVKHY